MKKDKMSPLKPVPSLSSIAIEKVIKIIHHTFDAHVQTCSDDHNTFTGKLCSVLASVRRDLLENISSGVADRILRLMLLRKHNCKSNIHTLILPLLFTSETKSISFQYRNKDGKRDERFSGLVSDVMLRTIANHSSTNIVDFRLSGWLHDDVDLFESAIINMPMLEIIVFELLDINDEYFRITGKHCSKLRELYIDIGSLTKTAIEKLCFYDYPSNTFPNKLCSCIQVCSFECFDSSKENGATPEDIVTLLKHCPNLKSMGKYDRVVDVLCLALKINIPFSKTFLVLSQNQLTENKLKIVSEYCQEVRVLNLQQPQKNVLVHLGGSLEKLKTLKTFCTDDNFADLLIGLENYGKGLEVLHIDSHVPVRCDFKLLSDLCPNLKELRIQTVILQNISRVRFLSIKKLDFSYVCFENDNDVPNFLNRLSSLKEISIGFSENITDYHILPLLLKNPFPNLEKLHLSYCNSLTAKSVEAFIHNCPKLLFFENLRVFQNDDVNTYQFLTEKRIEMLKQKIKSKNLRIDLRYHSFSEK